MPLSISSPRRTAVRQSETPRRLLVDAANTRALLPSNQILEELKKVTSRLETFSERLDSLDGRIKTMDDIQVSVSASTSSSSEEFTRKNK